MGKRLERGETMRTISPPHGRSSPSISARASRPRGRSTRTARRGIRPTRPGRCWRRPTTCCGHRFRNSWPPHQWMDLGNGSARARWVQGAGAGDDVDRARHTWVTELSTAFALTGDVEVRRQGDAAHAVVRRGAPVRARSALRRRPRHLLRRATRTRRR